jgi:hypothetical protein
VTAGGILIVNFLYLPVNLALFRLYSCANGSLSADSSMACWGAVHIVFTVVCSMLVLPVTLGFPLLLYTIIKASDYNITTLG